MITRFLPFSVFVETRFFSAPIRTVTLVWSNRRPSCVTFESLAAIIDTNFLSIASVPKAFAWTRVVLENVVERNRYKTVEITKERSQCASAGKSIWNAWHYHSHVSTTWRNIVLYVLLERPTVRSIFRVKFLLNIASLERWAALTPNPRGRNMPEEKKNRVVERSRDNWLLDYPTIVPGSDKISW